MLQETLAQPLHPDDARAKRSRLRSNQLLSSPHVAALVRDATALAPEMDWYNMAVVY